MTSICGRARAIAAGNCGTAGGGSGAEHAVQAASLFVGGRHRVGRGPQHHVFYRISWPVPRCPPCLSDAEGRLPSLASPSAPHRIAPAAGNAAAPRHRQDGPGGGGQPRCGLGRRRRLRRPRARYAPASGSAHRPASTDGPLVCGGSGARVLTAPQPYAAQWTRWPARWPTSGTRPALPGVGRGAPRPDAVPAVRPWSGTEWVRSVCSVRVVCCWNGRAAAHHS